MPVISEEPRFTLKTPIKLYARTNGSYQKPIMAFSIDMRLEDNPYIEKSRIYSWAARIPDTNKYLVWTGKRGLVSQNAEATQIPEDHYILPDSGDGAWWEWVEALDKNYELIKAPKSPRNGELGAELVDEKPNKFENTLNRVFSYS